MGWTTFLLEYEPSPLIFMRFEPIDFFMANDSNHLLEFVGAEIDIVLGAADAAALLANQRKYQRHVTF